MPEAAADVLVVVTEPYEPRAAAPVAAWQHTSACDAHAGQLVRNGLGDLAMRGFVELDEAAADAEDQRDLHVHAAFLDDGCTAAVLVDRVAGEAEGFHVTALGDLLVAVVADHADAVESEGQIVCFQDSAYSRAKPDAALVREDGALWYDGEGQSWLDPTSAETLGYITALVKECGELGFREVLLDRFCYPGGDTSGIANGAEDRVQVLTDFAEKLRGALPEGVALSVVVRDTESLSVAQMAELFDRLYVPAERAAAVKAALPEDYDTETRVVVMAAEAQSGSDVVVK